MQMPTAGNSSVSKSHLETFVNDGDALKVLMVGFMEGSLTKSQLACDYLTVNDKLMRTNAQLVIDNVKNAAFDEISATNNEIFTWMKSFYHQLFNAYVSLQKYMESNDTRIEDVARTLDIWRRPTINFQSSEVRIYMYVAMQCNKLTTATIPRDECSCLLPRPRTRRWINLSSL